MTIQHVVDFIVALQIVQIVSAFETLIKKYLKKKTILSVAIKLTL